MFNNPLAMKMEKFGNKDLIKFATYLVSVKEIQFSIRFRLRDF